jgi:hypothetical protein
MLHRRNGLPGGCEVVMKRLFGKAPVPQTEPEEIPGAAPLPESPEQVVAASPSTDAPEPAEPIAFELREPTPEEMATPILFEQDSISLDGLYSDQPGAGRTSASAPVHAELHGFLEHFHLGHYLGGWAGDHADPTCRTLQVAALVDGKEVARAIAKRDRPDTPHGGFEIPFADPQVYRLILDGRLQVQVSRPGAEPVNLTMLPGVIEQARSYLPPEEAAVEEAAETPAPAPRPSVEFSYLPVPVGFVSPDQAAIVGRKSFLFELGDLAGQYAVDPQTDQQAQRDAARWLALFRARQAALAQRGIVYVQTVMPDKATVLNDLAPPGLGPITARLALLEAMVDTVLRREGPEAVTWYRSLIGALRGFHAAGIAPFLYFDTHLRTAATQLVFYQFVQKLSALLPNRADELAGIAGLCGQLNPGGESDLLTGDLAMHFGLTLSETEKLPDLAKVEPLAGTKPIVARMPRQGHIGTRLMWRNPKAPSSLKIVAFGSSIFGRGDGARDLSWWFKAMFGEFHFVWSNELDLAYVDQNKPDIVICQGVERAMPAPGAR